MKLAIMQPYLFPYLGYWQLLASVDMFVVLDDVHYINRGWINRNRVAVDSKPIWMTVPLSKASQNRLIREIDILPDNGWKSRMKQMLSRAYAQAPEVNAVLPLFYSWLENACGGLSRSLYDSIGKIAEYLDIATKVVPTSSVYPKNGLKGQRRILDICRRENATIYVNLPGGRDIYDVDLFRRAGIELLFLQPDLHTGQLRSSINDGTVLSIIDHMMHNPREALISAVTRFDLQAA
jgi:hypothetical protein